MDVEPISALLRGGPYTGIVMTWVYGPVLRMDLNHEYRLQKVAAMTDHLEPAMSWPIPDNHPARI